MKIQQLPMGSRFEYEGAEYTKTGPQLATGKSGQRLIPRYAVLKPVGEVAVPRAAPERSLSKQEVLAAFGCFHAVCVALVPEERQGELAAARADLLKALE